MYIYDHVITFSFFNRSLSQTEWIIDGERKTESSIEEMILGPLNRHIKADSLRFSSSGREDVDVKMLGNGKLLKYLICT